MGEEEKIRRERKRKEGQKKTRITAEKRMERQKEQDKNEKRKNDIKIEQHNKAIRKYRK